MKNVILDIFFLAFLNLYFMNFLVYFHWKGDISLADNYRMMQELMVGSS